MSAVPHYVTIDDCQMRIWRAGAGPGLAVLPGLAVGAAVTASRLAALCPGWSVTAIELPGALLTEDAQSLEAVGRRIAATLEVLGLAALGSGRDRSGDVAGGGRGTPHPADVDDLRRRRHRTGLGTRICRPHRSPPRSDGTHLTRLFAHLRDLEILEPCDRSRPARSGSAYLDPDERHETFVAWAADPLAYARHVDALRRRDRTHSRPRGGADGTSMRHDRGASGAARGDRGSRRRSRRPFRPRARRRGIWCDYADIADGRVHLRRAGKPGRRRPLLVFQSAPGSSAPLSGLIEGLAADRQVIAPDYLGNGDSAKPRRKVDIALLARDALQLADRLGSRALRPVGHAHRRAGRARGRAVGARPRRPRRARSAAAAAGRLLAGHSGELPAGARSRQMGPACAAGLEHAARHVPVLAVVPAATRRRAAARPARRCHAA